MIRALHLGEVLEIPLATPGDGEQGKGLQQPLQRGAWPAGTASHQGKATTILGEYLDQLAGLPIGPAVDDESRGQQSVVTIPETTQGALVIGPARLDLDPQLQVHLVLEQPFHVEARFCTYGLDLLTLVADDHLLLAIALHQDQGVDVEDAALFNLEALDLHRHRVGQLLAGETHQLLTDDLGGHEAGGTVGHVIFREEVHILR